jgi:hypothetical protein
MHNLIAMDKEGKLKPAQILQVSSSVLAVALD